MAGELFGDSVLQNSERSDDFGFNEIPLGLGSVALELGPHGPGAFADTGDIGAQGGILKDFFKITETVRPRSVIVSSQGSVDGAAASATITVATVIGPLLVEVARAAAGLLSLLRLIAVRASLLVLVAFSLRICGGGLLLSALGGN